MSRPARAAVIAAAAVVVVVTAWELVMPGRSPRPPRSATPTVRAVHRRTTHHRAGGHVPSVRARTAAVPILMYHVIAPPFSNSPYPGLYVPPAEFRAQMQALARAGYHAVTLDEVRSAWLGRGPLPSRPIVISFDNGYRTQYTQALPVLRRLGWVGDENLQLSGLPPSQGGLSRFQVHALVTAGWELDTQGYSHADLIRLDPAQLHYQVAFARELIRRRYHVRADWFCYPSGHYDTTVVAAVEAAGFVGSTTVAPGWARPVENRYRLPRLRVLGGTSPRALLALIAGARDAPPAPAAYPVS